VSPASRLAILSALAASAQAVALRARAFGLDIVYHNRQPPARQSRGGCLASHYEPDLDTAGRRRADILTLHCPAERAKPHHVLMTPRADRAR
jgi:glyoxylate reductase